MTNQSGCVAERFELITEPPRNMRAEFAAQVTSGLSGKRKQIPAHWLYDKAGSNLFEEICGVEEYYPTRCEAEILAKHSARIVELVGDDVTCVELGSGSAVKTRLLLDAFFDSAPELTYVPIDISRTALQSSARSLLALHDGLQVIAIAGEYARGFEWMEQEAASKKLVLWLGSSIGNLDRDAATEFLREMRTHLTPDDHLLLGADLRKDRRVLEAAYDDSQGVTSRFSLNLLQRINRELGGDFDIGRFEHIARFDDDDGCVRICIESSCDQTVRIADLDLNLSFRQGERIYTEDAHKYSFEEIDDLARNAGYGLVERWTDGEGRFSLNLFRAG